MAESAQFGGIGRAWRSRNFRFYWLGNAVSILGFWVHVLAMGWIVWQLTKSELWLGLIAMTARMPAVFLSPIAGAVADRFGLRRVAVVALAISATNSLLLYLSVQAGFINVYWILAFAVVQGASVSFDLPARQALMPSLVHERGDLSAAIALNTTTFQAGAFVGPMIFGALVAYTDLPVSTAFLINSISFFFFTLMMLLLRIEREPVTGMKAGDMLADIVEGVRYVRSQRGILAIMVSMFFAHLLIRSYIDLLPAFADKVFGFHEDPTGLAYLQWASGAGALIGGVVMAARGRTSGLTRLLIAGLLAGYLAYILFAATSLFALGIACMFLTGLAVVVVAVSSQSLIQTAVDQGMRGRVISLTTGMAIGVPSLGSLVLGWFATILGLQLCVIVSLTLGLVYWLWSVRYLATHATTLETP